MSGNERKCSLCQNHMPKSEAPPSKAHKKCFYNNDEHIESCVKCQNVVNRRSHVAKEKKVCYVPKKDSGNAKTSSLKPGTRTCRNCHNHDKEVPVRNGHRKVCPMRKCDCVKCAPTKQRRISSTKFTKQLREQKLGISKHTESNDEQQQEDQDSGIGFDSDNRSGASSDHQSDLSSFSLTYSLEEDIYEPAEVLNCTTEEIEQAWNIQDIQDVTSIDDCFLMAYEIVKEDSFMEHQICVTSINRIQVFNFSNLFFFHRKSQKAMTVFSMISKAVQFSPVCKKISLKSFVFVC